MTPQEHYARAERLLKMAEEALDRGEATPEGVQILTSIAAVHAQLSLFSQQVEES